MSNEIKISRVSGSDCIYGHYHPESREVFYIGRGKVDAARAFRGGKWRTKKWNEYIDRECGGEYIIKILSYHESLAEVKEEEDRLIKIHQPLINVMLKK